MDPDSSSLDHRDRAVSSEPASTRPNPFDDTDHASRKRRRTSMSGSPAKSFDVVNLIDSPSSGTIDGDAAISENTEPTKIDTDSISPQTPEHQCGSTDPPLEAPSSMVTINLRKLSDDEPMSSQQSPTIRAKERAPNVRPDEVKASVEAEEVEMIPNSEPFAHTPQSCSLPESPPIELITVQSDDDMEFTGEDDNISIIRPDQPAVDPLQQFPYKEPDESLMNTLHRLTTYLNDRGSHHSIRSKNRILSFTEPNIEEAVLDNFRHWLNLYVKYISSTDLAVAQISCRQNREFWLNFPELVFTMLSHRYNLGLHLCCSFD